MKSQLSALIATFAIALTDAFHVHPHDQGRFTTALPSTPTPNTNTESTSSTDDYVFPSMQAQQYASPTDNYVFPSVQAQQMEQQLQGQSRFGIRKTLKNVVATFATHRELEAAGLIDESDRPEDVNRKAAEKFASFAKQSKLELDAINGSSNELQSALIETAAALGRTTGQIFGGKEPENYRD